MAAQQKKISELDFIHPDGTNVTEKVLAELQEKCPDVLKLLASCDVFPASGAGPEGMAVQYNVQYWGKLPLDTNLLRCCEMGKSFVDEHPETPAARILNGFVDRLVNFLPVETVEVNGI